MDGVTTRYICPWCRAAVTVTGLALDADQEADVIAAVLAACTRCRDAVCPGCGLSMADHAEMTDWGSDAGGGGEPDCHESRDPTT